MKILIINSGSSSLKYTLFQMRHEQVLFSGAIDRIGLEGSTHVFNAANEPETTKELSINDHGKALDEMLNTLVAGPLKFLDELAAVGHRLAYGGKYLNAVRIDTEVMAEVRRVTPMFPLHHPAMIIEIEQCMARMPEAEHIAVFDSWFHATIPDKAAIYGLPYRYFEEKGYRRIGYHGNSHSYVAKKAAEYLKRPVDQLKMITCHLGNGASLCAIDRGKSIDTTLGITAVEGLIMGTRSGDVDPGLIAVIMKEESISPDEMINLLYKESGLEAISGVSRDMREIEAAANQGNPRAVLALDAFCYKVKRCIGSMLMVLGGCDALVFTGGIGRNSPTVRSKALEGTAQLGFIIDETKNTPTGEANSKEEILDISADASRVKILAIETFEELMMARLTKQVLGPSSKKI